jgi:N6-adenosine-specific RNA methylase IME4
MYKVLVADPPWQPYKDEMFTHKIPYKTLDLNGILRFPLPPMEDDSWLFLWRLTNFQKEALDVARVWGFDVISELVWVKTCKGQEDAEEPKVRVGLGMQAARNAHEICLIARRGKPERSSNSVSSVFYATPTKHSEKPDRFYEIVEELTGCPKNGGKIMEFFSRRTRPGWEHDGDQCPGKMYASCVAVAS